MLFLETKQEEIHMEYRHKCFYSHLVVPGNVECVQLCESAAHWVLHWRKRHINTKTVKAKDSRGGNIVNSAFLLCYFLSSAWNHFTKCCKGPLDRECIESKCMSRTCVYFRAPLCPIWSWCTALSMLDRQLIVIVFCPWHTPRTSLTLSDCLITLQCCDSHLTASAYRRVDNQQPASMLSIFS